MNAPHGVRRRAWLRLAALALPLPAAVAAQDGAATAAEVAVEIRDYRFTPATLSVKAGTTVAWTNRDRRASHSVLFAAEGGLESERLFEGDTYRRRFDAPGRYPYTCGPHPEMKGLVEVTP